MAQPIPAKVAPGDLITASYMGQIIDALNTLDQRVSNLESTTSVANPVQITGYTATQPVHIGDQIAINGTGFVVPSLLNQVTMGGVQVTNLSSNLNSSTKLYFNVPNILGATSAGTPATITVTNTNGSATSPFQVLVQPANTAPGGQTQLVFSTPPTMPSAQPNITAGVVYDFGFILTAVTNLPANYSLAASATGAGWSAQISGSSTVSLAAGASTNVAVQVTAGTGTGTVSMTATETTPGSTVAPGNAQQLIITGSPPPTPVTSMRVLLAGAQLGASLSGAGVAFKSGQVGVVGFTVLLTEAGNNYTATAAMQAPNGWAQGTLSGSPFNVQPAPPVGTPAQTTVSVSFTAGTGAAATTLTLTVNAPDGTSVSYGLPVTVD